MNKCYLCGKECEANNGDVYIEKTKLYCCDGCNDGCGLVDSLFELEKVETLGEQEEVKCKECGTNYELYRYKGTETLCREDMTNLIYGEAGVIKLYEKDLTLN
jgi:hypothetical protein